jgi:endoglucanase
MSKKTLILLFICILSSCKSTDSPQPEPEIMLSKTELRVAAAGGVEELSVRTNVSLATSSDREWCVLTQSASTSAATLKYSVTVAPNVYLEERKATLTFKGGDISQTVNVVQLPDDGLSVEQTSLSIAHQGGEVSVKLNATSDYSTSIRHPWIVGKSTTHSEAVFAVEPNYGSERVTTITLALKDIRHDVTLIQSASESIPVDLAGMESDAPQLSQQMWRGWNLGNALEAPTGETSWGNAMTTETLIKAVKAAGFNSVRIPCAWDSYIIDRDNCVIRLSWLQRVRQVVDYCVNNDMYAIINIHWDGGWLENSPLYSKEAEVTAKMHEIWTQIATYFRDYDQHLLFAGTNEVHVTDVYTEPTVENISVQHSFNQTFVDAVRQSGGKNAVRNLIVQSYNTNIEWAVKYLQMPADPAANRLMVEVHYYDPYFFTLAEGSNAFYYWGEPFKQYGATGDWAQEDYLNATFELMKTHFGDKGLPVILGEYAATRRLSLSDAIVTNHLASRAYYLKCVTATALKYNMVPFYWDSGAVGNNGSGIFNRVTGEIADLQALDALISN